MRIRTTALALLGASALLIPAAQAQFGTFPGPDIFKRGAGDIGTRAGSAVDFRLFAGVSEIYDNGIQPASLDSTGHISPVNALYGTEVNLGVYGQHQYKHAKLGLDYRGVFRHYNTNSYFDGSDHQLALGYTFQKSQRLTYDFREVAGLASQGAYFAGTLPTNFNTVVDPTTLLFDDRTFYTQSIASATYLLSARTDFTVGGNWSTVGRQSSALVGLRSYGLNGSIEHQHSKTTSLGVTFTHTHYDFSQGFGESDINMFQGFWNRTFEPHWVVSIRGGIYQSAVTGIEQVSLPPLLAQLLGVSTAVQAFYRTNILPSAELYITRSFKNSWLILNYSRSITPGNGVYLTSRQELAGASYAYSGIHKWTFNVMANYGRLSTIGQAFLPSYSQYSAGTGANYSITRAIYASARVEGRHYDITDNALRRTAYRISLGLVFSPADIPFSFR